ncbi:hypothetical protein NLQ22_25220, partial [Escherichia coli]|nr:hypothetical protein [Escherichia coli]
MQSQRLALCRVDRSCHSEAENRGRLSRAGRAHTVWPRHESIRSLEVVATQTGIFPRLQQVLCHT